MKESRIVLEHNKIGEHEHRVWFGDLHNHGAVGYGFGSPERAWRIAHSHLDFAAVTPHAYWDKGTDPSTWKPNTYPDLAEREWPRLLELVRQWNRPGEFVAIAGYERHSSHVGDHHILLPVDDEGIDRIARLTDAQAYVKKLGALLVPHHPGYIPSGSMCAHPELWDAEASPVVEIYSEHGAAESDLTPRDYVRHTGRCTTQTMRHFLSRGHRFGVVASTDNHLGFPGAYGEGKAAILAPELTREALFEALHSRRSYAVTGDKILMDVTLNGALMGQDAGGADERDISVRVGGWHWIDKIEVLKNNRVIHREFPIDTEAGDDVWDEPLLLRIEYGWGKMTANKEARPEVPPTSEYDFDVHLDGAEIVDMQTCFQSGPFREHYRHVIGDRDSSGFSVRSYTSRWQSLWERDTQAIVLKIRGGADAKVSVKGRLPGEYGVERTLGELLVSDSLSRTNGDYGKGEMKLHRLCPERNARADFRLVDKTTGAGPADGADWYDVRVTQANLHMAWTSPIWVASRI